MTKAEVIEVLFPILNEIDANNVRLNLTISTF